jgi:hypothetical protein
VSAVLGCLLTGTVAFAVSNWLVDIAPGSSGQARAGTVSNLIVSATSSPSPANVLFPEGTGDVVVSIANPNSSPVTITAFHLPTNATYATGYVESTLATAKTATCSANGGAAPSMVSYNYATASSGTVHTLTTPLVVGAKTGGVNGTLVATLTNAAAMGSTSPNGCQGAYFAMPSFTGITAAVGGSPVTTSPATSGWTS